MILNFLMLGVVFSFPLVALDFLRVDFAGSKIPLPQLFIFLSLGILLKNQLDVGKVYLNKQSKYFILFFLLYTVLLVIHLIFVSEFSNLMVEVFKATSVLMFIYLFSSVNLQDRKIFDTSIFLLLLSSSIMLALLVYRYAVEMGVFFLGSEWSSPTEAGKNRLAFYLSITTPIALWAYIKKSSFLSFESFFFLIHMVSLVYSMSRGAWVTFSLSLVVALITLFLSKSYVNNRKKRSNFGFVNLLIVAAVLFWIFVKIVNTEIYDSIVINIESLISMQDNVGNSMSLRKHYFDLALEYFMNNPILGIGVTNFYQEVGKASHNSYLQILAESGLIGFGLYFFAVILTIRTWLLSANSDLNYLGLKHAFISGLLYLFFINAHLNLILYLPLCLLFATQSPENKYLNK